MNFKTKDLLRLERIKKGLRQIDIAKLLNMEQASYAKYESGRIPPTTENIIKLADFYDVTTDYLLGRDSDVGKVMMRCLNQGVKAGEDIADDILARKKVAKKKKET